MNVDAALELFAGVPKIRKIMQTLHDVGLGYLPLGQAAPTLSGGEAQRVKLAAELARPDTGRTLYVLDEPTTGLHLDDTRKLLDVVHRLADLGNTVVIIEHNLEVIKTADWIIDIGPEAGERGRPRSSPPARPRRSRRSKGSLTGAILKGVLAAGPHAERPRFDPKAAAKKAIAEAKAAKRAARARRQGPLGGRRPALAHHGPGRPVRQARPLGRPDPREGRRPARADRRLPRGRLDAEGRGEGRPAPAPTTRRSSRPRPATSGSSPSASPSSGTPSSPRPWPPSSGLAPFHEGARPVLSDAERITFGEPQGGFQEVILTGHAFEDFETDAFDAFLVKAAVSYLKAVQGEASEEVDGRRRRGRAGVEGRHQGEQGEAEGQDVVIGSRGRPREPPAPAPLAERAGGFARQRPASPISEPSMNTRPFGKTGFRASEMGLGCWQLGGADWGSRRRPAGAGHPRRGRRRGGELPRHRRRLRRRPERGADRAVPQGARPERVYVATKLGRAGGIYPDGYTEAAVRAATEASLRRLGVEALDLTQLHCVPDRGPAPGRGVRVAPHAQAGGPDPRLRRQRRVDGGGGDLPRPGGARLAPGHLQRLPPEADRRPCSPRPRPGAWRSSCGCRWPAGCSAASSPGRPGSRENDHRNYNRDGQAFNVGETFAGLPFEAAVDLAEALKPLVPAGMTMARMAQRWILDHDAVSVVITGASRPEQARGQRRGLRPAAPGPLHERLAAFYRSRVEHQIRGPY